MSCDGYETGSAFQVVESITPRSLNSSLRGLDGNTLSFDEAVERSQSTGFLQRSLGIRARSRLGRGRSGVVVRTMHGKNDQHFMLAQSGASFFLLSDSQIQKVKAID